MTRLRAANRDIVFGALALPLVEQLDVARNTKRWRLVVEAQTYADAVVLLAVHGILTDTEKHAARLRIVKVLERVWKTTNE